MIDICRYSKYWIKIDSVHHRLIDRRDDVYEKQTYHDKMEISGHGLLTALDRYFKDDNLISFTTDENRISFNFFDCLNGENGTTTIEILGISKS